MQGPPVSPPPRSLPGLPPTMLDRPCSSGVIHSRVHHSATLSSQPAAATCPVPGTVLPTQAPLPQLSPHPLTYLAERPVRRPTVSAPRAQPGSEPKDGTQVYSTPGVLSSKGALYRELWLVPVHGAHLGPQFMSRPRSPGLGRTLKDGETLLGVTSQHSQKQQLCLCGAEGWGSPTSQHRGMTLS